ncbi:hypothetical protein PFICI_05941 [Pestalotiopsis fici W106-1]|uniref:Uncharacterized protein n=1 Tax=Pestalotiopsis fici (strain W106-1 / CGMCC3.15140) TaxID=1229662 RepID=W3XDD5_PESFW|nr:uncharacterized protein PFICI_05941 [Pestalotiopsis fici W106-1]ETS84065.1 hypothetical protein PFICI_05941 [Pestalotiopsis fici W106-1]
MEPDAAPKALRLNGADLYEIQDLPEAIKKRPPSVSLEKPSLFQFLVSSSGHHGAAEVCVTPSKKCQRVYDSCIRPIQWTFHDVKIRRLPPQDMIKLEMFRNIQDDRSLVLAHEDAKAAISIALRLFGQAAENLQARDLLLTAARHENKEMMEYLWDKSSESWEAWLLYANCRRVLQPTAQRRKNFDREDSRKLEEKKRHQQNQAANSVSTLNSTVNNLCQVATSLTPGCFCGLGIYSWFLNERLRGCGRKNEADRRLFSQYMTAVLRAASLPYPSYMAHIPAVVALLCNESCETKFPYQDVCKLLGLDNLAGLTVSSIQVNQPLEQRMAQLLTSTCPSHGQKGVYLPDLASLDTELQDLSKLQFIGSLKRRMDIEGTNAYQIQLPLLDDTIRRIVDLTRAHVGAELREAIKWRSRIVAHSGYLYPGPETWKTVVVPLIIPRPNLDLHMRYMRGKEQQELLSTHWRQPSIIDGDISFGVNGSTIVSILISYYRKAQFEWLDAGKQGAQNSEWSVITPGFWQGLMKGQ